MLPGILGESWLALLPVAANTSRVERTRLCARHEPGTSIETRGSMGGLDAGNIWRCGHHVAANLLDYFRWRSKRHRAVKCYLYLSGFPSILGVYRLIRSDSQPHSSPGPIRGTFRRGTPRRRHRSAMALRLLANQTDDGMEKLKVSSRHLRNYGSPYYGIRWNRHKDRPAIGRRRRNRD